MRISDWSSDVCSSDLPTLLPDAEMEHYEEPTPWIPRIAGGTGNIWETNAHEQEWVRAAKDSPRNRTEASSHFGFSGPFNEAVVMGVLAVDRQSVVWGKRVHGRVDLGGRRNHYQ